MRINISDHSRASYTNGVVKCHEVGSRVAEVAASAGGEEHQHKLEEVGDAAEEEGVKGTKAKALNNNTRKLPKY